MAGDGTLTAQIVSQGNTNDWAKAGVMLRLTTDPGSPYYAAFVTPANGVAIQWRTAQGDLTSQVTTPGTPAMFLQITRTGTTFSAATSPDGNNWTPVANSTVDIPSLGGSLLSGLAVTSHDTGNLSTVVANSVVVTP